MAKKKQLPPKKVKRGKAVAAAGRKGSAASAQRTIRELETRQFTRGIAIGADHIEQALADDKQFPSIAAVVGEEYARQLQALAAEVQQTRGLFGPRTKVFVIPGILGSTLAVGNDTIWFDVLDIARGRLVELSLDGGAADVVSNGVFWPTYTELYLKLKLAGFDSEYFHFDWRRPITDAGRLLAERIRSVVTKDKPVGIVAHSMGGLVCRAAIEVLGRDAFKLIANAVFLGTPNFGSYAPALAMTNDYSTVKWVERLDLKNPDGKLINDVFSTFVGLAEMCPEPSKTGGLDLFNFRSYPAENRAVRKDVLSKAEGLQSRLAKGSQKIWMIAGVGIDTVVGLEKVGEKSPKFKTVVSRAGDGTVPLELATLPGANNRFCSASHGNLPLTNVAIRATIDILKNGETDRLEASPDSFLRSAVQHPRRVGVLEDQMRLTRADDRRDETMQDDDFRAALEPLLGVTPPLPEVIRAERAVPSELPVIIGRKKSLRLDLRLTQGDIADAEGRALMLGVFKDVRPGGAAGAVDARLGGILAEVIDRRMFSANVGEVFVLPTLRRGLAVEMVVLIGLGNFSQFTLQSLRSSVENATRTLLNCNVDELVTVPMGGGSGLTIPELTDAIIEGVQAAMIDARRKLSLRSLCITTKFPKDYSEICAAIFEMSTAAKFNQMEFVLEREIQKSSSRAVEATAVSPLATKHNSAYLIVRESPSAALNARKTRLVEFSLLGTTSKATVLSGRSEIPNASFENLLELIKDARNRSDFFQRTPDLGRSLAELVMPHDIRAALSNLKGPESPALTVINDLWGSRVPWELLQVKGWNAMLDGNLSRMYSTSNISIAKWLHERRVSPNLELLLVANPTEDLMGAKEEGEAIRDAAQKTAGVNLTEIWNGDATRDRLAREFASGKYDVVHYAGHAFFDEDNRSESGILCAGQKVLSGRDLATLDSLPSLVVFNACEAARIRSATFPKGVARPQKRGSAKKSPKKQKPINENLGEMVDRNVSFAEAFLRGGVGAYIGTYWPVFDDGAAIFAEVLYKQLLAGATVGASLKAARTRLHKDKKPDWVNFIHYGDPEFVVKIPKT